MLRGIAASVIVIAAFSISADRVAHGTFAMGDFKAFYCAGRALAHHENPYATAPIAGCESVAAPAPLFVTKAGEVLPAPLPGYAIVPFIPLSLLPFAISSVLWLAVLVAVTIAAIALFARVGVADAPTIAVALAVILAAICFPVGELPPVALFGIALAAFGGQSNRPWAIATGIALTFAEPQIGVAMLVVAMALGRRTAIPALGATIALGLLSIAAVGIAGNLEYLRVVLPAHLLSELPSVLQYSLSWMLYQLGVAPGPALLAGRLSWIVMLGVAFWFGRSKFAAAHPEAAMLAAPVFAIVGGPFLHLDHIALAIPATLWLASRSTAPLWLRTAIPIALSIPVLYIFSIIQLSPLVPFIAAWIGTACARDTIVGLRTALVTIVVMAVIAASTIATGTGAVHLAPVAPISANLPQAAWAQYVDKTFVMTAWTIWLVKAPIWLAILGAVGTLASMLHVVRLRETAMA